MKTSVCSRIIPSWLLPTKWLLLSILKYMEQTADSKINNAVRVTAFDVQLSIITCNHCSNQFIKPVGMELFVRPNHEI